MLATQLAAVETEKTAIKKLLKLYQDAELTFKSDSGALWSFGQLLCEALHAVNPATAPATPKDITEDHLKQYYAQSPSYGNAAPATIDRALQIAHIFTLMFKAEPEDLNLSIRYNIKDKLKQKGVDVANLTTNQQYVALLESRATFSDAEISTLYSTIMTALRQSGNDVTVKALRYIDRGKKEATLDGAIKRLLKHTTDTLKGDVLAEYDKQYAEANSTKAGRSRPLEAQDFIHYHGEYKQLLIDSIQLLATEKPELYAGFNRVARSILRQYRADMPEDQLARLNAKLQYTFGVLAVVLRDKKNGGFTKAAETIEEKVFAGKVETKADSAFPKEDLPLFPDKLKSLFGKVRGWAQNFRKLLGQDRAVPQDVATFIVDNPITTDINAFVTAVEQNNGDDETKRRFVNQLLKLRDQYKKLLLIEESDKAMQEAGATFDGEETEIIDIAPRPQILTAFEHRYLKLKQRISLTADPLDPAAKRYFNPAEAQAARDASVAALHEEFTLQQTALNAQIARIRQHIETINAQAHFDKLLPFETRLTNLEAALAKLNEAIRLVDAARNAAVVEQTTNIKRAQEMKAAYDALMQKIAEEDRAVMAAAQQATRPHNAATPANLLT